MNKNMSFEEALSLLEKNVSLLEGDVSLDESLKIFNESVLLVKLCNEKLDMAEKQVRVLIEQKDGTVDDAPFDLKNEN